MDSAGEKSKVAFLVDLEAKRKIPIITPECRVGRADENDIVIADTSVSRFHMVINYQDGKWLVANAQGRHGVFLNGNEVTTPEAINDGDVIKLGGALFWVVIEAAE
jgi:pSer/pThr/pTyr-binding forkhead associated (FHA) protein